MVNLHDIIKISFQSRLENKLIGSQNIKFVTMINSFYLVYFYKLLSNYCLFTINHDTPPPLRYLLIDIKKFYLTLLNKIGSFSL